MTRINLEQPQNLTDQHLIAEYRELPRIFTMVHAAQERGITPDTYGIPHAFRLGAGHMKFFADKLYFLNRRFNRLVHEGKQRGYKIQFTALRGEWKYNIDQAWWQDYKPTAAELAISNQRLFDKIQEKPSFYTWYGKKLYSDIAVL